MRSANEGAALSNSFPEQEGAVIPRGALHHADAVARPPQRELRISPTSLQRPAAARALYRRAAASSDRLFLR